MTERMRLVLAAAFVGILGAGFWQASATTSSSSEMVDTGELEAAAGAVQAWASFATTGDIGRLAGWFAIDGPQYSQLETEVADLVSSGRYKFSLSKATLVTAGLVRGLVTVTGIGGSQTYRWDIELIKEDGRWRVWTVRTSP